MRRLVALEARWRRQLRRLSADFQRICILTDMGIDCFVGAARVYVCTTVMDQDLREGLLVSKDVLGICLARKKPCVNITRRG